RLEVSSNRAAEDAACRAFGGTTEPRLLHPCEDAKAILLLEGQASCRMLKLAHAGHTSTHNSRSIPAKDPHASVVGWFGPDCSVPWTALCRSFISAWRLATMLPGESPHSTPTGRRGPGE